MKKFTILLFFLTSLWGYSQVKNYTFAATAGTYTEITDGTSLGNETSDDQFIVNPTDLVGAATPTKGLGLDIGFTFIFNGYAYDRFGVNINGQIFLGTSSLNPDAVSSNIDTSKAPLSLTAAITPEVLSAKIAALGSDLQAQTGSTILYKVIEGQSPGNKTLVIQWKNYKRRTATADSFNFQIRLHETTNVIEFVYGSFSSTQSSNYSAGLRAEPSTAATNFRSVTSTTNWAAPTMSTAANNQLTISSTVKPANGLTYTYTPPACSEPKALVSSSATANSATMTWGALYPAPAGYEYVLSTSSTAPTAAGTFTANPTITVNDLTPKTKYTLFVRTSCGSSFSQWIALGTINTKCDPFVFSSDNFDSQTYDSTNLIMPYCWENTGTTGSCYLMNGIVSPGSPANAIKMSVTNGGAAEKPGTVAYAITPALTNLNSDTHKLRFKVYCNKAGRTLDVGYFADGSNPNSFTVLETFVMPSTAIAQMLEFTVTPPALNPVVRNLVFRCIGIVDASDAYLDDVIWEPKPASCTTTLSNVGTKFPTDTTVQLNWDSNGNEKAWQYVVGDSSVTDPTTLPTASIVDVTSRYVTVGGLTPNSSYKIWVRSNCGDGTFGNWTTATGIQTNAAVIQTTCAPTIYKEDFDGLTAVPGCYRKLNTNGTLAIAANTGTGGTNGLAIGTSSTGVTYVGIPPLNTTNVAGYRLRFKYKSTVAGAKIEIISLNDAYNTLNYNWTTPDVLTATTANTEYIYSKSLPATVTPNIAFRVYGSASLTATIDDLAWEPIPACPDPANIVVKNITDSSAQLTWDSTGSETAWQYVVAPSTVKDPSTLPASSIVDATAKDVPLNGLTPGTSFKIWVRSNCGSGAYGYWIPSTTFTTFCSPAATFLEDFDSATVVPNCFRKLNSNGTLTVVSSNVSGSSNALKAVAQAASVAVWVGLPPVSTSTAGYRLRFKYKSDTAGIVFQVANLQDPLNIVASPANFTVVATPTAATKDVIYPFNQVLTGTTPYFAFRIYHTSTATPVVYIDDIVWEPVLTCPDITAITQNDITDKSVVLGWTGSGTETKWQYALTSTQGADPNAFTAVDFVNPAVIDAPTVKMAGTISNLNPATPYKVWIRAKCDDTSFGPWTGPFYFSTNCLAVANFEEKFDTDTNLPACWKKVGNASVTVAASIGINSTNALKIDGTTTTQGVVAMKPVNNAKAGTNILRFKLSGQNVGGKLQVGYMTNPTDIASFKPILPDFTVGSSSTYSIESIELGNEPTSQVLAFRNPGTSTTSNPVYVDDVVWEALPTCGDVSIPTITSLNSTAVGLSWTKADDESAWQYALSTTPVTDTKNLQGTDFIAPVEAGQNVSSTLIELLPSTTYHLYVRSKCTSTISGAWIGPLDFTTTCPPVTGFTQNFDADTNIPSCWTKVGTQGTVSVAAVTGTPSGKNALKLASTATAKAMIAVPPVNNSAAGTYRLRFKFNSTVADGNIQLGYVTNITDSTFETDPAKPTSFHLVEAVSTGTAASGSFVTRIIKFDNKPTSEILAFRNPDNSTVSIDNVVWEPIPDCLDANSLKVGVVTSSSANLTWKAGNTETAWQYALGLPTDTDPTSDPVDIANPVLTAPNVAGTITGLTSEKPYKVWVRAKCGDASFGTWSDPIVITTTCAPVGVEGFTQNFDTTTVGTTSIPTCWTKIGTGTAYVTNTTATSSPNIFYMNSPNATTPCLVAMQPVSNASAGTHRLKFNFRGNAGVTLEIGYLDNIFDASTFHKLAEFTPASATAYEPKVAELGTAPLTQILAFRIPGQTSSKSIYMDDVVWEPLPACPDMGTLTAGAVTNNTFNLSWTSNNTVSAWQYALGSATATDPTSPIDFASSAITGTDIKTASISGLTGSTTYKIWVRNNCGDGKFGKWSSPLTFTTACDLVSTFTQDFDTSTNMPSCWSKVGANGVVSVSKVSGSSEPNVLSLLNPSTTNVAVVAMPKVTNASAGTHRLRFKVRGSVAGAGVEVGYLENETDPASFKMVQPFTTSTSTFDVKIAELGTAPTSQIIAFRNTGTATNTMVYIDNVVWEPIPTCANVVSSVSVSQITSTSVNLSWDSNGTAWQYVYGPSTVTDPNTLPSTSIIDTDSKAITINGLNPTTAYKIWVRSKCDSSNGAWSDSPAFTTTCAAVTSINENFEAGLTLPSCWYKVGTAGTVAVVTSGSSKALSLASVNTTTLGVASLPAMSGIGNGTHYLRMNWKAPNSGMGLEFGYLINPTDPTSFVKIASFASKAADKYQEEIFLIDVAPASQVLSVRKPGYNTTTVYIDDISIQTVTAPLCADPTAVVNATCGNYPTQINWAAVSLASGYKITVGTTSGGNDILNKKDVGNVLTYSVTADVNKTYYYTVTPYNNAGDAATCVEKSYTTSANNCLCISVPTGKDGKGITNVMLGATNFAVPDVATTTYNDFSQKQINMAPGANTNLQISFQTGIPYGANVWIDFNNNLTFEPTEIVSTGTSANEAAAVLNVSFVMPANAPLGVHRMRIGAALDATVPNPCYSGANGVTVDFNVNLVAPPANDNTLGAATLTVGKDFAEHAISGTNVDATGSVQETDPNCGNYSGSDVWYKATVPASGNITFEVNSIMGGITNTAAAVYTSAMVLVACDDSSSTTGKMVGDQPKIALTGRTPGETLYLRVWENGGDAYGEYLVSAYDETETILSTDQFEMNNFRFYPNPVVDVLNISSEKEISNVIVTNILGQQVISKSVNANHVKIDMSDLSKGTYLVKVISGNQSKTIKAIRK